LKRPAHATAQGQRWVAEKTDEHYDLVVVGAGISGLSAAYIYRRDVHPHARILILDNHDDFGGHAKRNEFTIDGRTLIGFGGTMLMTAPSTYPAVAKQVIRELGIEADRYDDFHHKDLFAYSVDTKSVRWPGRRSGGDRNAAHGWMRGNASAISRSLVPMPRPTR
jgi:spermidine dehydrogenase